MELVPDGNQENGEEHAEPSNESELCRSNKVIVCYLMERATEFRELSELRRKGWDNPEGDKFFQKQRYNADKGDARTAQYFYKMMKNIGQQLHDETGGFGIPGPSSGQKGILDLCVAPGGFLATALKKNPWSQVLGFSLPTSSGGHEVLLLPALNVRLKFLDITMLAADMGMTDIPVDHPDAANFLPRELNETQIFGLVICDGQVLRTQTRASYREPREARRLITAQLVLGIEHVSPGGTMIVLLHKLDAWETVYLLYEFSKFSSIKLFKPTRNHSKRSSFYLVATGVQPLQSEAVLACKRWKSAWKIATFGTDQEYSKALGESKRTVEEVLEDFGSELVRLGRKVWDVQAKALAQAPFIRDG